MVLLTACCPRSFKRTSNLASGDNSRDKPAVCKAPQQYLELNGIKLREYAPDINNYNHKCLRDEVKPDLQGNAGGCGQRVPSQHSCNGRTSRTGRPAQPLLREVTPADSSPTNKYDHSQAKTKGLSSRPASQQPPPGQTPHGSSA